MTPNLPQQKLVPQDIFVLRESGHKIRLPSMNADDRPKTIHGRIKKAREGKGWTLVQLAKQVSIKLGLPETSYLSYQTVQSWEREDGTAPSRKRIGAVAAVLGLTEHELSFGPIEPAKPDLGSTAVNNDTYIELGNHWPALSPLFQQALLAIAKEAARNVKQAATTAVAKASKQPGLPARQKGKKTTA